MVQDELQERVRGYLPDSPGVLTISMVKALQRWQSDNRVPVTGDIDSQTWYALFGQNAPPFVARALSAASWMLGMGASSRLIDGPLGPRWGQWGMSFRSGCLQQALRVLKHPIPGSVLPEMLALDEEVSQIAWFLGQPAHRRSLAFLPSGGSGDALALQGARAQVLTKGLVEQDIPLEDEIHVAKEIMIRVLLDTPDPNDLQRWLIGDPSRLSDQVQTLRGLRSEVPTRRGSDEFLEGSLRSFESFGIG
mgnify:FL=1